MAGDCHGAAHQQHQRDGLRHHVCHGTNILLVTAVLKGQNQVRRVEFTVTIPIAGCPTRIHGYLIFVLITLKHPHQIITIKLAVQVRIAIPGVLEFVNPRMMIV